MKQQQQQQEEVSSQTLTLPSELFLSLILCDSSFPGGSLANSNGLESAILNNLVIKNDRNSLKKYLDMSIEQTIHQSLPFVRTSYYYMQVISDIRATNTISNIDMKDSVYKSIYNLDEYCHAFLSNNISRRTSVNQGKCFLRVIKECFPFIESYIEPLFPNNNNDNTNMNGHYSILFGIVCSLLNISLDLCEKMFLKIFIRDLLSAAIRLNQIGPIEATTIQIETLMKIESLLNKLGELYSENKYLDYYNSHKDKALNSDDYEIFFYLEISPKQSAPIIDLLQSKHDQLYSRLFSS